MKTRLILAFVFAALTLGACADPQIGSGSALTELAPTIVADDPGSVEGGKVASIDPGLQPLIDRAVNDLARRLDVPPSEIFLETAFLVRWPDTSYGCPNPDKAYATGAYDGSVIELDSGDAVYRYHTAGDTGEPFLCEAPSGDETVVQVDPLEGTPLELETPIEKYPDETVPPPGYDE